MRSTPGRSKVSSRARPVPPSPPAPPWDSALVAFAAVAREGLETVALPALDRSSADGGEHRHRHVARTRRRGGARRRRLPGQPPDRHAQVLPHHRRARSSCSPPGSSTAAVQFLQASNDIGSWNDAAYDVTRYRWLTRRRRSGRFLAGIFGWDPRPSIEQVLAYLLFLIPIGIVYFAASTKRAPRPRLRRRDAAEERDHPIERRSRRRRGRDRTGTRGRGSVCGRRDRTGSRRPPSLT